MRDCFLSNLDLQNEISHNSYLFNFEGGGGQTLGWNFEMFLIEQVTYHKLNENMRGIACNDTLKKTIADTMDTGSIPTTFVHLTLLIYTVCFIYISILVFL